MRKRGWSKKAISKGLSKNLILLGLIITIAIVLAVIILGMINENKKSLGIEPNMEISQVLIINDSLINVKVKKNTEEEYQGVLFRVYDKENNLISEKNISMSELQQNNFETNLLTGKVSNIEETSISPIITSELGKQKISSVEDEIFSEESNKIEIKECVLNIQCNDNLPCTQDICSGNICFHNKIISCMSGDGCCPSGCTYSKDKDCKSSGGGGGESSGNSEEDEEEPPCIDTCSSLGYECGVQNICGVNINCGSCLNGYNCSSGKCLSFLTYKILIGEGSNTDNRLPGINYTFNTTITSKGTANILSCILSLNNGSGIFVNYTTNYDNDSKEIICSVDKYVNETNGTTIQYQFFTTAMNETEDYILYANNTVKSLLLYYTPTGEFNWIKYGNVSTYHEGGTGSFWVERDTLYGIGWTLNDGVSENYLINTTNEYDYTWTTNLTSLHGVTLPNLVYTTNGAVKINGKYHLFGVYGKAPNMNLTHFTSTDKTNWKFECRWNASINRTIFSTGVYYDEATGIWDMIVQDGNTHPNNNGVWYNSSDGCNWVQQNASVLKVTDAPFLIKFAEGWIIYYGIQVGSQWRQFWAKGPDLNHLEQQSSIPIFNLTLDWEEANDSPHLSDGRMNIIPEASYSYFDKKVYFSYIGGNGYAGVLYDEENRDFYKIYNITKYDLTTALNITLIYPTNYENFTTEPANFTVNVYTYYYNLDIANVSLIIDGLINESNLSGINGSYAFTNLILSNGKHNWSINATGSNGKYNTSYVREFWFDWNITSPLSTDTPTNISTF